MGEGTTKVVEKGHTLVLGWNEASPRVLCQISFLRAVFQQLNEGWTKKLFPWTRTKPSSPIVTAPIV